MPTYEVLYDVSIPTGKVEEQPGGVKLAKHRDVPGGVGETVDLPEEQAAPLVEQGILTLPEQAERSRRIRQGIATAHQTAEEARAMAAAREEEARAIEEQGREEAASRIPERRSR